MHPGDAESRSVKTRRGRRLIVIGLGLIALAVMVFAVLIGGGSRSPQSAPQTTPTMTTSTPPLGRPVETTEPGPTAAPPPLGRPVETTEPGPTAAPLGGWIPAIASLVVALTGLVSAVTGLLVVLRNKGGGTVASPTRGA